MDTPELIRKKRDGLVLTKAEVFDFVERYTRGEIPDYQASALLMAIYFRGMDRRETADLTEAMLRSGRVLDFSALPAAKVDKHSTGGVGDKTSLIIAPAAAAAGVLVPMISGRGLGHTGGTLDKLEAIPGFSPRLSFQEFHRVLEACGLALGAATEEFAPADRKLYALRDVTATVESIPLITASIMSKKLAEGIDGLVLDVKTGAGAFMQEVGECPRAGNQPGEYRRGAWQARSRLDHRHEPAAGKCGGERLGSHRVGGNAEGPRPARFGGALPRTDRPHVAAGKRDGFSGRGARAV